MPEPLTATAVIEAATAVAGAVEAVGGTASGETGFNVARCNVHYPKEFPANQFAHSGQAVEWDIIKYTAHGGFWDNYLSVSCSGYLSHDNTQIVGYPNSEHPHVPVNRFALLSLDKSGTTEDMSRGLLTVSIGPWGGTEDIAEGSAEDPWVALRVNGRFDPMGPGDMEYSFKLGISTFGQINLSHVTYNGNVVEDFSITNQGDHILVYLN